MPVPKNRKSVSNKIKGAGPPAQDTEQPDWINESAEFYKKSFKVLPFHFAALHSEEIPNYGVWHMTVSQAAKLICFDRWLNGEIEVDEVENWERYDDPRILKLLTSNIKEVQSQLENHVTDGRLKAAYIRKDIKGNLLCNETLIHYREVFKWINERGGFPSAAFEDWWFSQEHIDHFVKKEAKYLHIVLEQGVAKLINLVLHRLAVNVTSSSSQSQLFPEYARDLSTLSADELRSLFKSEVMRKLQPSDQPEEFRKSKGANVDRPIATKGRRTMLVVIAALCEKSGIDFKGHGIAKVISGLTHNIGAPVEDDAIRDLLKDIPEALKSRSI